jgi:hypothetical protein
MKRNEEFAALSTEIWKLAGAIAEAAELEFDAHPDSASERSVIALHVILSHLRAARAAI